MRDLMSDICLVFPRDLSGQALMSTLAGGESLGIGYLASSLRNAGFTVRIINAEEFHIQNEELLSSILETNPKMVGFSPVANNMASNYLNTYSFDKGEDLLHGQIHEAILTPSQPTNEWEIATRLMQSMFKVTDNIWSIVPAGRKSILPVIINSL